MTQQEAAANRLRDKLIEPEMLAVLKRLNNR